MGYKVVQWATGKMGMACLRAILEHDDLELVGLRVYNNKKVGRDAGEIAGGKAVGVIATDDIEDILALDADVVVHAARLQPPYSSHNADMCRLLESGKNVISINGHTFPWHWGPDYVQPLQDACQRGGTTFFGTGLNPGFISEKLVAITSSVCTHINSISISEIVPCNFIEDPQWTFDILGFGTEIGSIDPNDESWVPAELINGLLKEVVHELIDRLGLKLERIETDHIMHPATTDIEIPAGVIRKGTNSHINWRWYGIVDDQRFFTMSVNWIMESSHLENPDRDIATGWDVRIDGLPSVDLSLDFSLPKEYPGPVNDAHHVHELALGYGMAGSVVNSIPLVCAAAPGIFRLPIATHYKKSFGS
jgi:hypothetical protein